MTKKKVNKKRKKNYNSFIFGFFLIILISLAAAVTITGDGANPSGTIYQTFATYNYNISITPELVSCVWSWNALNTSIYSSKLIAGFDFDNLTALGETGTQYTDITGRYNGTLYNYFGTRNVSAGKYNNAIGFNGTNQHLLIPGLQNIGLENYNFSVEFWIKTNTQDDMIVAHGRNAGSNNGWIIGTSGSTSLDIQIWNNTDNSVRCVNWNGCTASSTLPLNTWKHVLVNFDVDGKNMSAYIDGTIVGSTTWLGTLQVQDNNFTIGMRTPNQNPFMGQVDKFRLYNQTFNDSQIKQLYYSNLNRFNATMYQFYVNETDLTAGAYSSALYCVDGAGDSIATSSFIVDDSKTILVTNPIGNLTNWSYGANFGVTNYLWQRTGGIPPWNENITNVQGFRNLWQNTSMNNIRIDGALDRVSYSKTLFDTNYTNSLQNMATYLSATNQKATFICSYTGGAGTNGWNVNLTQYSCSSNNKTCMPKSYQDQAEACLNLITQGGLTPDLIDIEVWNEPDLSQFLLSGNALDASGAMNRSIVYNAIYKAHYDTFKANNSAWQVGGPGLAVLDDPNKGATILNYWMKNFTTNMSFVSWHTYLDPDFAGYNLTYFADADLDIIIQNCTAFGANCNQMKVTEFGLLNTTINADNRFRNQSLYHIAGAMMYLMNNYPSNISMNYYAWAGYENFNMVNEDTLALNNTYITIGNYSKVAPSSSMTEIYSSSISNTDANVLVAKYWNTCGIIIQSNQANLNFTLPDLSAQGCTNNFTNGRTLVNYSQGDNFGILGIQQTEFFYSQQEAQTDFTAPAVSIVYPTNVSYTYANRPTMLNYTFGDASTCWYSTDGGATNSSLVCGTNSSSLTPSVGVNVWLVGVNDTSNNINMSLVYFDVQAEPTPAAASDTFANSMLKLLMGFTALLAMVVVAALAYSFTDFSKFDTKKVIYFILIGFICVILTTIAISIIAGSIT